MRSDSVPVGAPGMPRLSIGTWLQGRARGGLSVQRSGARPCATLRSLRGTGTGRRPGRLAQRESASFTPRRSLVRSQYRPPRNSESDGGVSKIIRVACIVRGQPWQPKARATPAQVPGGCRQARPGQRRQAKYSDRASQPSLTSA
jgi:hypothetical protein